jgi:hypothetical protein
MRKHFYRLYSLLASYPVLALLLVAILALYYLGQSYKPFEQAAQTALQKSVQLKQELESLRKQQVSLEQSDLRKRYILFNQDFLTASEAEAELLKDEYAPVFAAYGWILQEPPKDASALQVLEAAELPADAEPDAGLVQIKGIQLNLWARSSEQPTNPDGDPFLPLHSMGECIHYLWSRPPTHDYERIQIVREDVGYSLETRLFFPLQDPQATDPSSVDHAAHTDPL